jgi:hypothetical protein
VSDPGLPPNEDPDNHDVPYDAGEDFDAADHGEVVVPEGTDAILFAQQLEDLAVAGFPRDPDDPDGSKLALTPVLCEHGKATSWTGIAKFGDQLPEVEHCEQCNPDSRPLD